MKEGFEVPMVAFCYDCGHIHSLYPERKPAPEKCEKCGSKKIDTWGVEVTRTGDGSAK